MDRYGGSIGQGLTAAVQHEIGRVRPGALFAASAERAQIGEELRPDENDGAVLGLAKAVARQCVAQIGVSRSARPIEAVRQLRASGRFGMRPHQAARDQARVLAAARRG